MRIRNIVMFAIVSLLVAPLGAPQSTAASPELVDGAQAAGLFWNERTWSASEVDYNNDGYDDIWVGFHQRVDSKLMRNNKNGTFTYVAPNFTKRVNAQGGVLDRHDCAWADVDHNGLQDAYCSGGRNQSNYVKTAVKDNELWLQQPAGTFTDVGTQWGIGDECGRGRFVTFLDVNNDGWDDLFLGNEKPRNAPTDPCNVASNNLPNEESKIFINNAGQGLTFSTAWAVRQASAGVGCAVALDYNRDGRMDLLACNYKTTKPNLYRNTGTGFAVDTATGLSAIADAVWEDINGDGRKDLVMADKTGFLYRLGGVSGLGAAVRLPHTNSGSSIFGWGVAVGDIDGDGDADIYGQVHNTSLSTNPDDVLFRSNGGTAPTFTKYVPPSAGGNASTVTAIKLSPDANTSFFVQNGREDHAGPSQLIQWRNP